MQVSRQQQMLLSTKFIEANKYKTKIIDNESDYIHKVDS